MRLAKIVRYDLECKIEPQRPKIDFETHARFKNPKFDWNSNNTWQNIGDLLGGSKVFSAYFDFRLQNGIGKNIVGFFRIFAILLKPYNVSCVIRYENDSLKRIAIDPVEASIDCYDWELFCAYIIKCPYSVTSTTDDIELPKSIALTYGRIYQPLTFVPISYPSDMNKFHLKPEPKIAVCVSQLFGPAVNPLRIVEFIEIYRILGASHFYFYVNATTVAVQRVLDYYREQEVLNVLHWNVTIDDNEVLMMNECIYRAAIVDNFSYATMVNIDQIIMPIKQNSLKDFLQTFGKEGKILSFLFRKVFFYKTTKRSNSPNASTMPKHIKNRQLVSQTWMQRSALIVKGTYRSRCLVNVRAAEEISNHLVFSALPNYKTIAVGTDVGLLFRYRNESSNCDGELIADHTGLRFDQLIMNRVERMCLQVFRHNDGVCPWQ